MLPNIQSKPSLAQFEAIPSCPIAHYLVKEMQVTPLPSIHLLVNVLGLSGSPVTLTAQTIEALVQCQAKSIPHHCPQTPRHGEDLRRALAEQQVREQLEPKAPEPADGRAHAGVQTGFSYGHICSCPGSVVWPEISNNILTT
ncbi:uncharacterized protein LOC141917061 isoform X2 [Strix aluco]|uniref:uncharacterized protein LOC141917061 isoform X2 n=1 Tax=Strix aluco TaxID=111821 RepID=UPI003DA5741C